jgi:hypothetical protein
MTFRRSFLSRSLKSWIGSPFVVVDLVSETRVRWPLPFRRSDHDKGGSRSQEMFHCDIDISMVSPSMKIFFLRQFEEFVTYYSVAWFSAGVEVKKLS